MSLEQKHEVLSGLLIFSPSLTQQIHLRRDALLQMKPAPKTSLHLIFILLVFLILLQLLLIFILILILLIDRVAAADWFSEADPRSAAARQRRRRFTGFVLGGRGRCGRGRLLEHRVAKFNRQRRREDGRVVRQSVS